MADPYAGLQADFAQRVRGLVAASGGRITIKSGYRSPERQAQLVAVAKKKHGSKWRKRVAPAGKSRHNRGVAVDLGGDLALAARLAPQFGLHRPMQWEPWHFEPVGSRLEKGAHTPPPNMNDPDDAARLMPEQIQYMNEMARRKTLDYQMDSLLKILSGAGQ